MGTGAAARPHDLTLNLKDRSVPVRFAPENVDWAASQLAAVLGTRRPKLMLVTDERVALHYAEILRASLTAYGFDASAFIFIPGELHKTLFTLSLLLDELAAHDFARDDLILALGGGVTTDLAGLAASLYKRGISWIAVPTSLLAMVDASIGGKTGVDHPFGKNLIGSFHQPLAVFAPMETLRTLDAPEWISGSAEVFKSALLSGGELWHLIERNGPNLYEWPADDVNRALPLAAEFKINLVSRDERDEGVRRLLNLGHTFGHALESLTGYQIFRHGEAVFLGLRAVVRLSEALDLLSPAVAAAIETRLEHVPYPKAEIDVDALVETLQRDKKVASGKIHWILLHAVGKPVIQSDVPSSAVIESARWLCDAVAEGASGGLPTRPLRVLVINGPNVNLLGEREPEIYGTAGYEQAMSRLANYAAEYDTDLIIRHSNVEGEIVNIIQQARHWADGIIINPGGYTHTSVAIRDAIAAVTVPTIEVHLTDISQREKFRQRSLIAPVCAAQIMGEGVNGYRLALERLVALNRDLGRTLVPKIR